LHEDCFFGFLKYGVQRQDLEGDVPEAFWCLFARLVDVPGKISDGDQVTDTKAETHVSVQVGIETMQEQLWQGYELSEYIHAME
jgi:hypothetical protein